MPLLAQRPKVGHSRIAHLQSKPVEPLEYCKRWIADPTEHGNRQVCEEELARLTGLSQSTIRNWGKAFEKRPDYVVVTLGHCDLLRRIEQQIQEHKNRQD